MSRNVGWCWWEISPGPHFQLNETLDVVAGSAWIAGADTVQGGHRLLDIQPGCAAGLAFEDQVRSVEPHPVTHYRAVEVVALTG